VYQQKKKVNGKMYIRTVRKKDKMEQITQHANNTLSTPSLELLTCAALY